MILELESHFNRVGIILSFHQLDFKTTAASGVARGQAPGCSSRSRSLRELAHLVQDMENGSMEK